MSVLITAQTKKKRGETKMKREKIPMVLKLKEEKEETCQRV